MFKFTIGQSVRVTETGEIGTIVNCTLHNPPLWVVAVSTDPARKSGEGLIFNASSLEKINAS